MAFSFTLFESRLDEHRNKTVHGSDPADQVYIHASSKLDRAALDWLRDHAHVTLPAEFVHGTVVAVVEIVDVLTEPEAAAFSPWFCRPYGPVSANIRPLRTSVPQRSTRPGSRRTTGAGGSHARLRSTAPHRTGQASS